MKRLILMLGVLIGSVALAARVPVAPKVRIDRKVDAGLLDINRAELGQLMSLPGMGEAWAVAIVHNRPYANKSQLKSRGVIPLAEYRKIQAKIVARH